MNHPLEKHTIYPIKNTSQNMIVTCLYLMNMLALDICLKYISIDMYLAFTISSAMSYIHGLNIRET